MAKLVQKYAQWRTGGHRLSLEDFRDFWRSEQAGPPPPPIFIQEDAGGADATLVGGAGAPPGGAPAGQQPAQPEVVGGARKRPHEQVKRVIDLAATARAAAEASAALDEEAARLFELVASFDAGESHGYSVHGAEPTMKQRDFQRLLLSNENSAIDPKHNRVHMDMTRPLSHYWIHSSHNTYLVGNQLSSESSADMYRRALAMGCRCIEIDCFDGPLTNEPLVYHKFSATTKISLRSVLEAINECAFPSPTSGGGLQTDYPVILSFENHCTLAQQKVMARMMIEIFGDKLLTPLTPQLVSELPANDSPEALRGKIIVKGKRPAEDEEDEEELRQGGDSGDEGDEFFNEDEEGDGGSEEDESDESDGGEGAGEVSEGGTRTSRPPLLEHSPSSFPREPTTRPLSEGREARAVRSTMMDGSTLGAVRLISASSSSFQVVGRETSCESVIEDDEEEDSSRFSSSDRGDGAGSCATLLDGYADDDRSLKSWRGVSHASHAPHASSHAVSRAAASRAAASRASHASARQAQPGLKSAACGSSAAHSSGTAAAFRPTFSLKVASAHGAASFSVQPSLGSMQELGSTTSLMGGSTDSLLGGGGGDGERGCGEGSSWSIASIAEDAEAEAEARREAAEQEEGGVVGGDDRPASSAPRRLVPGPPSSPRRVRSPSSFAGVGWSSSSSLYAGGMSTSAARELLSVNINMVLESEILDRALRAMLEAEAGGNRRGSDKGSDTEAAAAAAAAASEIRQDRTSIVSDDGEGGEGEGEGEGSVSDATLPPEAVDGSLETALVLLRVCDDLRKLAKLQTELSAMGACEGNTSSGGGWCSRLLGGGGGGGAGGAGGHSGGRGAAMLAASRDALCEQLVASIASHEDLRREIAIAIGLVRAVSTDGGGEGAGSGAGGEQGEVAAEAGAKEARAAQTEAAVAPEEEKEAAAAEAKKTAGDGANAKETTAAATSTTTEVSSESTSSTPSPIADPSELTAALCAVPSDVVTTLRDALLPQLERLCLPPFLGSIHFSRAYLEYLVAQQRQPQPSDLTILTIDDLTIEAPDLTEGGGRGSKTMRPPPVEVGLLASANGDGAIDVVVDDEGGGGGASGGPDGGDSKAGMESPASSAWLPPTLSVSALLRLGRAIAEEAERVRQWHGISADQHEDEAQVRRRWEHEARRSVRNLLQAAGDSGMIEGAAEGDRAQGGQAQGGHGQGGEAGASHLASAADVRPAVSTARDGGIPASKRGGGVAPPVASGGEGSPKDDGATPPPARATPAGAASADDADAGAGAGAGAGRGTVRPSDGLAPSVMAAPSSPRGGTPHLRLADIRAGSPVDRTLESSESKPRLKHRRIDRDSGGDGSRQGRHPHARTSRESSREGNSGGGRLADGGRESSSRLGRDSRVALGLSPRISDRFSEGWGLWGGGGGGGGAGGGGKPRRRKKREKRIDPELAAITAMHAIKFDKFESLVPMTGAVKPRMSDHMIERWSRQVDDEGRAVRPPLRVCSFGERKAEAFVAMGPEWRRHNLGVISRVYPRGDRVSSSNIEVLLACKLWECGVQMVCFNLQTQDSSTLTNRALFELNGGCGYILKPPSPEEAEDKGGSHLSGMRVRVRVLSAHNLPKTRDERCEPQPWDGFHPELSSTFAEPPLTSDVVRPQVEIEAFGGKICPEGGHYDEASDLFRCETSAVTAENGLCVAWDDSSPPFACDAWAPECSFLRVSVYNTAPVTLLGRTGGALFAGVGGRGGGRQLLASEIVPLQALRHGYRSLQLRSPNGCHIEGCKLLLHIELERITKHRRAAPRHMRKAHGKHRQPPGGKEAPLWHNMRLSTIGAVHALKGVATTNAGTPRAEKSAQKGFA